jgi:hypothetical protein
MIEPQGSHRGLILGVHPCAHGVGWAVFESPLSPIDWAVSRSNKNAKCIELVERLFNRYTPSVVVLEAFEKPAAARTDRMQLLCRAVVQLAHTRGCEIRVYPRAAIRTCFATLGARTRYEIAQATAAHIPALRNRLPPMRKFYNSQDARLSLFNASALVLTHFALADDQAEFR